METQLVGRNNAGSHSLIAVDTTDDSFISLWLRSGKRAGSVNTQRTYARIVAALLATVRKPLQYVNINDLLEWRENLSGSAATQKTHIAAVKSLFAFGVKVGYLKLSPAVMLDTPKLPQQTHRRALDVAAVQRMISVCEGARERALLMTLYHSGARISEILALQWGDVIATGESAVLIITRGKGGRSRQAGIKSSTYAALMALRTPSMGESDYVFATRNGTPLDRHAAHRTLKKIAQRAGVDDASCHWLRHSHATHSLAAGANVVDVQSQLGHASLASTTIYLHPAGSSAQFLP